MSRAKQKKEAPANGGSAGVTKVQRFEYREISRAAICGAAYNPRAINDYQRKQLRASLERFGLVEPPIWNEKTGTLVGGHQRLSIIDQLEGRPDYMIGVSVVRLTPKQEKELNVLLNNKQAQGDYTEEGILELLKDSDFDFEAAGMTRVDLEDICGSRIDELDEILSGIEDIKKQARDAKPKQKLDKDEVRKGGADNPENESEYFLVVGFKSAASKQRWLRERGMDVSLRHIAIEELESVIEPACV